MSKQFIRMGNPFEEVKKLFEATKKREERPVLFVINDDYNYGLYVKKLISIANKLGLVPFSKADLKHVGEGDVIVFGDSYIYEEEFDYRAADDIEENVAEGAYDNKQTVVLKLTRDLDRIIELLKKHYKTTKVEERDDSVRMFVKLTTARERDFDPFNTEHVHQFILMNHQPEQEDVRIHDNIVKIGYKIYRILEDRFGNEYIRVNGVLHRIMVDRFGKKYLD